MLHIDLCGPERNNFDYRRVTSIDGSEQHRVPFWISETPQCFMGTGDSFFNSVFCSRAPSRKTFRGKNFGLYRVSYPKGRLVSPPENFRHILEEAESYVRDNQDASSPVSAGYVSSSAFSDFSAGLNVWCNDTLLTGQNGSGESALKMLFLPIECVPLDEFLEHQHKVNHRYRELTVNAGAVVSRFIYDYYCKVEQSDPDKLHFMRVKTFSLNRTELNESVGRVTGTEFKRGLQRLKVVFEKGEKEIADTIIVSRLRIFPPPSQKQIKTVVDMRKMILDEQFPKLQKIVADHVVYPGDENKYAGEAEEWKALLLDFAVELSTDSEIEIQRDELPERKKKLIREAERKKKEDIEARMRALALERRLEQKTNTLRPDQGAFSNAAKVPMKFN